MGWEVRDLSRRRQAPPTAVAKADELRAVLKQYQGMPPRVVSVGPVGDGYLQIGIGGRWAFVEYCQNEPWRSEAAVPNAEWLTAEPPDELAFACGGEESEIPGEYLMPADKAISLVARVIRFGKLPATVEWELQ